MNIRIRRVMNWENKNVLITGMAGFLAPHIAKVLFNNKANIVHKRS